MLPQKNFKAVIKPFEAFQGTVKLKIQLNFFLRPGLGQEGLSKHLSNEFLRIN